MSTRPAGVRSRRPSATSAGHEKTAASSVSASAVGGSAAEDDGGSCSCASPPRTLPVAPSTSEPLSQPAPRRARRQRAQSRKTMPAKRSRAMTPMGEIATATSRDLCGRHCTAQVYDARSSNPQVRSLSPFPHKPTQPTPLSGRALSLFSLSLSLSLFLLALILSPYGLHPLPMI